MNPESHEIAEPDTDALAEQSPSERERAILRDLAELVAYRVSSESRIRSEFQAALKAAERDREDSGSTLVSRAMTETQVENRLHEQTKQRRLDQFAADYAAAESQFLAIQTEAANRFETEKRRAKKRREEVRWEAETVYEATKNGPAQQLEKTQKELEIWRQHLGAVSEAALAHAARWLPVNDLVEPEPVTADAPTENGPVITASATETPAEEPLARLQQAIDSIADEGRRIVSATAPPFFETPALTLATLLCVFISWWFLGWVGAAAGGGAAILLTGGYVIWRRLRFKARVAELFPSLRKAIDEGRTAEHDCQRQAVDLCRLQEQALRSRRDVELQRAKDAYKLRSTEITSERDEKLREPSEYYPKRLTELRTARDRDVPAIDDTHGRRKSELTSRIQAQESDIEARYQKRMEQVARREESQRRMLAENWRESCARLRRMIESLNQEFDERFPEWRTLVGGDRPQPEETPKGLQLGTFRVRLGSEETNAALAIPADALPTDPTMAEQLPADFTLPVVTTFPDRASLLIKASGEGRAVAVAGLQALILRILTSFPPGKARFTIIDPVGLGENFAAMMHLADYNEALITSRIWTEPRHIEERLADISEHMENVIQKYLRNEFASIDAYNVRAGEVAEPYRFLVVSNFPANFTDAAQRRLLSIASSGARCGVFTLIMVDERLPNLPTNVIRDLARNAAVLVWRNDHFESEESDLAGFSLQLDTPPPAEEFTEIVQRAGEAARAAGRVETPFEHVAPATDAYWTTSSRSGIDAPLGRAGATRLQALKLGSGTSQHVLVAGKTGSGKSTLLHALVTNLALRYSPDEIELYLVDFKQGVEFKTYATHRLPHARVVAVESDREFGLSVLMRLDVELKRRADRFRDVGAQDVASFRDAQPNERMPRIMLIVDEFQEFFVEDDKVSSDAALLLDRLVRQGRAFGVHILLGSQTLAGAYSLARSTIGQMAVRIALQCSESDAHLILSEDNTAARLLSRAGEAIYNDSNGLVEGNHPFQVVWLADARCEHYLALINGLAAKNGIAYEQVVFEGNVPADLDKNPLLAKLLESDSPSKPPVAPLAWLGESVSIKDPTSAVFRRQSGGNLLIVGQNDAGALGMVTSATISLAAHFRHATGRATIKIIDGSPADSEQSAALLALAQTIDEKHPPVGRRDLAATLTELSEELERRRQESDHSWPPIFVVVFGLHRIGDLRKADDDFGFSRSGDKQPASPAKQFIALLRDGPPLGIHAIVWCDSFANVGRAWERQTLRDFETRVALQMSSNDSSSYIDTPAAGRLGPNRGLLHCEEQGQLEKFRPYQTPNAEWLAWARERLS